MRVLQRQPLLGELHEPLFRLVGVVENHSVRPKIRRDPLGPVGLIPKLLLGEELPALAVAPLKPKLRNDVDVGLGFAGRRRHEVQVRPTKLGPVAGEPRPHAAPEELPNLRGILEPMPEAEHSLGAVTVQEQFERVAEILVALGTHLLRERDDIALFERSERLRDDMLTVEPAVRICTPTVDAGRHRPKS